MYQYCQLMMLHFIFVANGWMYCNSVIAAQLSPCPSCTTFTVEKLAPLAPRLAPSPLWRRFAPSEGKKLNNCSNLKSDVILLKNTVD